MGEGGTEVARQAADMLLTDDNCVTIEAAVEQGRTVSLTCAGRWRSCCR